MVKMLLPKLSIFFGLLSIGIIVSSYVFHWFIEIFILFVIIGFFLGFISLLINNNKKLSVIGMVLSLSPIIILFVFLWFEFASLTSKDHIMHSTVKEQMFFSVSAKIVDKYDRWGGDMPARAIALSPNDRYLFFQKSGYCCNASYIIDLQKQQLYQFDKGYVRDFQWITDDTLLLFIGSEDKVILKITNGKLIHVKNTKITQRITDNQSIDAQDPEQKPTANPTYSRDKKYYYTVIPHSHEDGCFQECTGFWLAVDFYSNDNKHVGVYEWRYKDATNIIVGSTWTNKDELIIIEAQKGQKFVIKKLII